MLQGGAKKLMSFHIDRLTDRNLREEETGSKTGGAWAWTRNLPSTLFSKALPHLLTKMLLLIRARTAGQVGRAFGSQCCLQVTSTWCVLAS